MMVAPHNFLNPEKRTKKPVSQLKALAPSSSTSAIKPKPSNSDSDKLLLKEKDISSATQKTVPMDASIMDHLNVTFIEVDQTPDTLWKGIDDDDDEGHGPQGQVPLARKSFLSSSTTISLLSDDDEDSLNTEEYVNQDPNEELTEEEANHEDDHEELTEEEASQAPVATAMDVNALEEAVQMEQVKEGQKRAKRFASFVQKNKAYLADHHKRPSIYNDDASVGSGFSIAGQSTDLSIDKSLQDDDDDLQEEGKCRQSSTVRFGSIVLNEVDVEALQEEKQSQEDQKTWGERRKDSIQRSRLQRQIKKQMQKLHKAHGSSTLLHPAPDKREETKKLTTTLYPSPTGEGLSVSVKFSGKESQSFYSKMPSFAVFSHITRDVNFRPAPLDWHVVITDVKGSTKAIESGRYKDVNTIGAASISVVLAMLEEDVPFVFGGDGATLLIPPAEIGRVLEALLRLQRLSEEKFRLGLRVGHISVSEVVKAGGKIEIAKHELTAGRCAAIFRGGGLTVAEACIKGQEDKYCLQWKHSSEDVELEGLSCRWNAIPSKRGKIMSLLVCAREGDSTPRVYDHVLQELDKIYDGQLDEANPVNTELMFYKTAGQCYEDEKRWHSNTWTASFANRVAEIFLAVGIFKFGLDPKFFDPKHYFESMRPHADHRKFDDMLRMVIDCSEEQAEAIEDLMEGLHMDGKVHYGIFLSDNALMTCYLEDLVDGQHIHFIDGGDGGYAMAAKQLKAQLKIDLAGV